MKNILTLLTVWVTLLAAGPASAQSSYEALPELSLPDSLQAARKYHPALKASSEKIEQAKSQVNQAWTFLFPFVTTTGTYRRADKEIAVNMGGLGDLGALAALNCPAWNTATMGPAPALCSAPAGSSSSSSGPIVMQEYNNFDATLTVGMDLLNARAFPAIPYMKHSLEAAVLDSSLSEDNLMFMVIQLYYTISLAQASEDLATEQLQITGKLLDLLRLREASGTALQNERLRLEMSQTQASQALDLARLSLRNTRRTLALVLGRDDPDFKVVPPAVEFVVEPKPAADSQLAARKDLQILDKTVEMTRLGVTDVYLRFLPTIKGAWNYNATSATGFSGDHTSWNATVTLSWSIFDRAQRIIALGDAKAKLREVQYRREASLLAARTEVNNAGNELESSQLTLTQGRKLEELAKENYRLVEKQYELGVADQTAVLDANREYLSARIQVLLGDLRVTLARISYLKAIGRLDKALGSL
jgi:outer membrane protein TolC